MKAKILVIEDNPEMCENISDILALGDYQVISSSDGKTGIDLAQKCRPDLILCDIMMQDHDGYRVLHEMRAQPETADIPFIFLTAKAENSDFRKGMNMGADDYIVKPFDGLELLKAVDIRLKKYEQINTTLKEGSQDMDEFVKQAKKLIDFHMISKVPNRILKKKEYLFKDGLPADALYYIIKGEIKTSRFNPDGKELITGLYREGQFVGYVPLLCSASYSEDAIALKDTEVGTIPKSDFQKLIYTNRRVAASFVKILAKNINENEKRLLNLAFQSVRQRVASAIIYLYHKQIIPDQEVQVIEMGRRDIAGIVGTSLESLNRTISDFREEGLIKLTGGGIKISNMEKLEMLSR